MNEHNRTFFNSQPFIDSAVISLEIIGSIRSIGSTSSAKNKYYVYWNSWPQKRIGVDTIDNHTNRMDIVFEVIVGLHEHSQTQLIRQIYKQNILLKL